MEPVRSESYQFLCGQSIPHKNLPRDSGPYVDGFFEQVCRCALQLHYSYSSNRSGSGIVHQQHDDSQAELVHIIEHQRQMEGEALDLSLVVGPFCRASS